VAQKNWEDYLIIQEGVYPDIDESTYRAAEGISKSMLWEFGEYATPLHWKARKPKVSTPDMDFGCVVWSAVSDIYFD